MNDNSTKPTSSEKIDVAGIKAIPIQNLMSELGYEIDHTTITSIFYKSPFRNEKTASFSISKLKNRWNDFGDSNGSGDIIDLYMRLQGVGFKDAIQALSKKEIGGLKHTILIADQKEEKKEYKIQKINPYVLNKALIQYMYERSITPYKIKGKVKEVYYYYNEKHYFSLAFENRMGSYEIRNKFFKGCIGQKDLTHIEKRSSTVTVFEGFIDYLSLQCWKPLTSDVIVLNSCSLANRAVPIINKYKKAYFMLDNDKMGIHTTKMIRENCTTTTIDLRKLYSTFKDVNEWVTANNTLLD